MHIGILCVGKHLLDELNMARVRQIKSAKRNGTLVGNDLWFFHDCNIAQGACQSKPHGGSDYRTDDEISDCRKDRKCLTVGSLSLNLYTLTLAILLLTNI